VKTTDVDRGVDTLYVRTLDILRGTASPVPPAALVVFVSGRGALLLDPVVAEAAFDAYGVDALKEIIADERTKQVALDVPGVVIVRERAYVAWTCCAVLAKGGAS
jgi:hypothetical protein